MQTLEEKNHLVQESEKLKKQLDEVQHERVNRTEKECLLIMQFVISDETNRRYRKIEN